MNIRIVAAALAIALVPATSATPALAASAIDRAFARTAAQAGIAEVAEGNLALATSRNPNVRAVARRMVRDHSAADDRLAGIAEAEGLALPMNGNRTDHELLAHQRTLHGTAFDRSYLRTQAAAHVQAIALFKHEIAAGSDQRLIGFARTTLPAIDMHLTMIRNASRRM